MLKKHKNTEKKEILQANQSELNNVGASDIKLLQDETQDEAFEKFKGLIEAVLHFNSLEERGPLIEMKEVEELDDLILRLAKHFSYGKKINDELYSFGYDFRERVRFNGFSRPISNWR